MAAPFSSSSPPLPPSPSTAGFPRRADRPANPDLATSPATAEPPQASPSITRTPSSKSVQFSVSPPPRLTAMPRQRNTAGGREKTATATREEDASASASSADETTAIVRRLSGSPRGKRDYQGVATVAAAGGRNTAGGGVGDVGVGGVAGSRTAEEEEEQHGSEGWFKSFVDKYGSIEVDNKGSAARDHLALERTFLAWLRTSLAFASIGIAITQLFRLNTTLRSGGGPLPSPEARHLKQIGKPLGATFLAISIVVLFIGFHRYFEGQHWIIRGKFPASRGGIATVAVMAGLLIVVSLVVVLAVGGKTFEK